MIQDQHARPVPTGEAFSTLSRGIAHDYLNRLQLVSSALGLIKRHAESGHTADILSLATAAEDLVIHAGDPVNNLLAVGASPARQLGSIEIGEALEALMPTLKSYCGDAIDLTLATSSGRVMIACHMQLLENAIINLIVNARDAIAGGGAIEITVSSVDLLTDDGGADRVAHVAITVADSGCGMSEETLRQAFSPSFTTKAPQKNLGLGLMMTRLFAERAGGKIDLRSVLGGGTSVTLLLPEHEPRASPVRLAAGLGNMRCGG